MPNTRFQLACGVCLPALALGVALLPAPARAQTPAATDPANVEQVVVTARHRAERAQTVPIAITTVDSRALQARGITSVGQLQKMVPSLQITQFNPRNTSFNIRGLGNNAALAVDGIESGVGVYVDGVFYARPAQATFAFPDLENIQVLRGPQGTLFGKNTTAGAIDVHTQKPSFTPSGEVNASVGNDGYWQIKGTATGPVTDKIAYRVSGLWDDNSGTISNPKTGARFNALNDRAVRAQLLAVVNDDLTVRVIADYGRQRQSAPVSLPYQVISTLTNGQPFPNGFQSRIDRIGYKVPTFDPRQRNTDDNSPPHYVMETGGVSAQADYTLPFGTVTSISSWRYWNWNPYNDLDATGLDVLNATSLEDYQKQASQEFRFTSPSGQRLEYTAGLYYFYEDLPGTTRLAFGKDAGNFILGDRFKAPFYDQVLNGLNGYGVSDIITNSMASYGQATYHVTPEFDITSGLRLTYETKDGRYGQTQFGGAPDSEIGAPGAAIAHIIRNILVRPQYFHEHTYDTALSGMINASYKVSPGMFVYASYSRGDKGSGINALSLPIGVQHLAKPETVDAYELGAKTSFLNNLVVFNADLFWSQDHNYQGVNTAPIPGAALYATYITNVPQVRTRGLEIDAHAILARGLGVYFGGAFTDAIYAHFPHGPCAAEICGPNAGIRDLSGDPVAGISRWTMTTGGEYSHRLAEVAQYELAGYAGADYSLRSSYNVSPANSAYGKIAGYGLLDVRMGVRTTDRRYDLSLWAHNATNTYYNVARGATSPISGLVIVIPGDPAMYGLTMRAKF